MNPRVSIIVPVYNAEDNLRKCIESVLKQDYLEFELLLMDDGSKDGSGAICDEYAKKDTRIHVVHKENSGVSDTRNQAIKLAKGEYLQFIDSDDWITPDATGLLVRTAEKYQCDMVISDFYRVIGERLAHKGAIQEDRLLTREEFAEYMMENPADFYYGVLWNKLYRKSIIEEHQLTMDKNISWCEDFIFNMEYIRFTKNIYALHVPIYYYVKTKGSLVSQGSSITKSIKMKKMVFKCYNEFYKDIFDEEDYEKNRIRVYQFLIDAAGDGLVPPSILPGSMKLGDERVSISFGAVEGAGFLFDSYRERKLLDRYLETVAIKLDMTLEEVVLLFYLTQMEENCSLQEMSSIMQIKKGKLRIAIQKLILKNLIQIGDKNQLEEVMEKVVRMGDGEDVGSLEEDEAEDFKKEFGKRNLKDKEDRANDKKESGKTAGNMNIELLPSVEPILEELLEAKRQYHEVLYSGMTEEEIEQYEVLKEKMKANVQRALK